MIYVGIDPGLDGAIAFYNPREGTLEVHDMPVAEIVRNGKKKREIVAPLFADILRRVPVHHAFLEKVGAMPGQGVSSVFSFGRSSGLAEGILAAHGIAYTIEPPQRWQKALGVREGKDGARLRAIELFPSHTDLFARKKDHGRADAALMARYIEMHAR